MPTETKLTTALLSERIKVRCPMPCIVRLCDREIGPEGPVLHVRYSSMGKTTDIYAAELVIKCRGCQTMNRITAEEGIVESHKDGTGI